MAGKRKEAQTSLDELGELSKQRYESACSIAAVCTALGDTDQAFAWLERGFEQRDQLITRLKSEQRFASLRYDPRFADLVRRIGIP